MAAKGEMKKDCFAYRCKVNEFGYKAEYCNALSVNNDYCAGCGFFKTKEKAEEELRVIDADKG